MSGVQTAANISASSLSNYTSFDLPTDLEIDMWTHWKEFTAIVAQSGTQSERVNNLQRAVSSSPEKHNNLISGMLFGILIAPSTQASQFNRSQPVTNQMMQLLPCDLIFTDMRSIVRDHYLYMVYLLVQLTRHNFIELKESTVDRILWLTEDLVAKAVPNLKDLVLSLLQQISVSRKNHKSLMLNKQLVDIFSRHVDWVCTQADRFPSIVFLRFLRQAEEHYGSGQGEIEKLRDSELTLCLRIWQQKQMECVEIGREFVRIFQNVAKYKILDPIKSELGKEVQCKLLLLHMLENRGQKPQQQNIYVSHLLTLEVQRKIEFMLSQLPEANMHLYCKWLLDFAGVEFGTESEAILTDMVRYIVVNVLPTNEIIQSAITQRYQLISHIITQQKHPVHQSWVLQALFIDWLFYDETAQDSIMLVEPGMLLIYRSTEKRSWITDMLVEFLDNYVRNYDPSRFEEALKSVQRVFRDCERKGVVGSILRDMINNPKLKPQTQMILKEFYMASERLNARQQMAQSNQEPSDFAYIEAKLDPQIIQDRTGFDQLNFKREQNSEDKGAYDQEMANDDGVMVGQFSPPYVTNDAVLKPEENSAFAGEQQPFLFESRSPSFEPEDSQKGAETLLKKQKPYKIDLIQEKTQAVKKTKVVSDSDNSSSESSSEVSDDGSFSSSEEEIKQKIEMPASVINRFFSGQESIQNYLFKRTQATTDAMLDDLCASFQIKASSCEELTELAYIQYECLKGSLACKDLLKLTTKWKDLAFSHIFRYLRNCVVQQKSHHFVLISQLIRSLAQFDNFFQAKLITHLLLEGQNELMRKNETEEQKTVQSVNCIVLQKYADIAYSLPTKFSFDQFDFIFNPNALVTVKSLVQTQVIDLVVRQCQFKYLNWFLIAFADLMPAYIVDNEIFLQTFLQFAVPATQSKLLSQIRLQNIKLFDFGIQNALQLTPSSYMGQRCLWSLLTASCATNLAGFKQREPLSQIIASTLLELIKKNKEETNMQSLIAGNIIGIQEFLYVLIQQADQKQAEQSFWCYLDLYFNVEQLENEILIERIQSKRAVEEKQERVKLQKQLRPVLREIAQIVLATFFNVGNHESHRRLLESVINECDLVMHADSSKQVQTAAFQRLKVAKDIFGSKLSMKTVVNSGLQKTVHRLKTYQHNYQQ